MGMECSECGKSPAGRYTFNEGGARAERVLCKRCYERLISQSAPAFFRFLSAVKESALSCSMCGTTLCSVKRTGLVGCAGCYSAFREQLAPALSYIQWDSRHEGKRPSEDAEKKYDVLREREALITAIREARRKGDEKRAKQLSARYEALAMRYPGEDV